MTLIARGDPRTERAIDIARDAHTWRRLTNPDGELVYGMPSQTTRGLFYLVTETTCTCLDFLHNGLRPGRIGEDGEHHLCKHVLAVHLTRIQREAADNGLVLEQLPNGEFTWLRAEA